MTLRQMEYLLAVVEEGSFTRAAERLFVSQPALSHQVKALERSVGGALLERLPHTVALTPLGREFLPHATAAVRAADEARRSALAVGGLEAGELRIATLHSIALGVIPVAFRAWRLRYPQVSFVLREFLNIEQLTEQMRMGVADLAVGSPPAGWEGEQRPLGMEELVVVLPVDDPLVQQPRRSIKLELLADRPWVLYAPDNGFAPVVLAECAAAGFQPRAAVRTHHAATAAQLAAAGVGPALVPENVVDAAFTGVALRADPPVRRELVAFSRASPSPLVSAFMDVLAEHVALDPR
jgi:DNA-binding transcriptional LysR family regulator